MGELTWTVKAFNDLTVNELYAIMRLRNEIFVVEQNCLYQEADNKDMKCYHLCGWENDELVAYVRLLPKGVSFDETSIGRVCVAPSHRKGGYGRKLMLKAIETSGKVYGIQPIKIQAQAYLQQFYMSLGFVQMTEIYPEDGIPHMDMLLTPQVAEP